MSYHQQYQASQNEAFKGRVIACVRKTAEFVLNEASSTPSYQQRRNLAQAIIADPYRDDIINLFMWECVVNGTIESSLDDTGISSSPDSDFEYVVNSVWNTVVNLGHW